MSEQTGNADDQQTDRQEPEPLDELLDDADPADPEQVLPNPDEAVQDDQAVETEIDPQGDNDAVADDQ